MLSPEYTKFLELIFEIGFVPKKFQNIILVRYDYKDYKIQIDPIFKFKNDGSGEFEDDAQHKMYVTYKNNDVFNKTIETEFEEVEKFLKATFSHELRFKLRKEKIQKLLQ